MVKKKSKVKELEDLGLAAAAITLAERTESRANIKIAMENYKYATQRDLDAFGEEIRPAGKKLEIVTIERYKSIPPDDVLAAVKGAKDLGCFTSFYVASIVKVKDPIIFAKVKDFDSLWFFVAQWGDDVKFSEIVGDNNA